MNIDYSPQELARLACAAKAYAFQVRYLQHKWNVGKSKQLARRWAQRLREIATASREVRSNVEKLKLERLRRKDLENWQP